MITIYILEVKEQKRLYEQIEYFASLKIFNDWSYNAVKIIYYQTEVIKYISGQYACKQNTDPNGIYIVKSGQFKVQ